MYPEKNFSPDIVPESQKLLAETYQEIPTMSSPHYFPQSDFRYEPKYESLVNSQPFQVEKIEKSAKIPSVASTRSQKKSRTPKSKEKQRPDVKSQNENSEIFSNPEKLRSEKTLVRSAPPASISDPANHIQPRPFIRLGNISIYDMGISVLLYGFDQLYPCD